jgi:transposase
MAKQAQEAMGVCELTAIADRGYFKGEEILACEAPGVTPLAPRPLTSGAKADGRFGKQDFLYDPGEDVYRCPAGKKLTWRYWNVEAGRKLHNYCTTQCTGCALKSKCTPARERRVKRWEHEPVLEAMQERLDPLRGACASDARPRNIHSEPSRPGWARPTSACAPLKRSERR